MVRRTAVALAAVLAFSPAWSRADIVQMIDFGDSLSDTGNTFAASGTPPVPYYQGRYSNGPVWVEYLATALGVAKPTYSLAGGTDYAWGGAESGLTGLSPQGTPNTGLQIATYLAAHPTLNPNQLVNLARANNFSDGQTDPTVPVNNIVTELKTLIAAGGKQFMVPNLPLLGDVPLDPTTTQPDAAGLNALTQAFNADLKAALNALQAGTPGVRIAQPDVEALRLAATRNPSAFGFTNVTTAAIADGVLSGAGYLYWDSVHPTTAAQYDIAAGGPGDGPRAVVVDADGRRGRGPARPPRPGPEGPGQGGGRGLKGATAGAGHAVDAGPPPPLRSPLGAGTTGPKAAGALDLNPRSPAPATAPGEGAPAEGSGYDPCRSC